MDREHKAPPIKAMSMKGELEYNTTRNKLVIPEYGRNVQKMINHIKTVDDKAKRTRMAYAVVSIMGQMNPHQKDAGDFQQKLWDHLHMIGKFELDIDSPYPSPSPEVLEAKPEKVSYATGNISYPHYGKHMEAIILKVAEMEEGEDKDTLVRIIANHLKKSYLTWNRESVNDDLIILHLSELSRGKINIPDNLRLTNTADILNRNAQKKKPQRDNRKHGGGRKRSNRN